MPHAKVRLRDSIIREPEIPVTPEVLAQMRQRQDYELSHKNYMHPSPPNLSACTSDVERTRVINEWYAERRSNQTTNC